MNKKTQKKIRKTDKELEENMEIVTLSWDQILNLAKELESHKKRDEFLRLFEDNRKLLITYKARWDCDVILGELIRIE